MAAFLPPSLRKGIVVGNVAVTFILSGEPPCGRVGFPGSFELLFGELVVDVAAGVCLIILIVLDEIDEGLKEAFVSDVGVGPGDAPAF